MNIVRIVLCLRKMSALFFLLIIAIDSVIGNECDVNSGLKDVQYYRQLWLENLIKAYKWSRKSRNEEFANYSTDKIKSYGSFDFVIVGGGNAGSVLANRLSENMKWKVLLIEAGSDDNDLTLMPGAMPILTNSDYNWGYLTKPQKSACFGMENNQCALNRAKHLGGDTIMASEVYMRASMQDFSKWSKISEAWSYSECLKYYKKAENMSQALKYSNHGYKGPQFIDYIEDSDLIKYIIEANKELGYKEVDYNNQYQVGVSKVQVAVKHGIKQSASEVYLKPIREFRKNLVILTKALPTKIEIMHKSVATGLNFIHGGEMYYVSIKKELLLCAGGYNSPKLLMLSGIGPRYHLASLNIPLVADLPVGKNLISRPHIDVRFKTNLSRNCSNLEEHLYHYLNGRGEFTLPITRAVTFGKFTKAKEEADYMILYNVQYDFMDKTLYKGIYNFKHNLSTYLRDRGNSDLVARVTYLHVNTRGTVELRSANPIDHVEIDPNYMSSMRDFDALYKSINSALKLLETRTFKSLGVSLANYSIPACENFTDSMYWHCIASYMMDGIADPMGTCKMGKGKDSVVDPNLIVHGFVNLRVIDASVIPFPISAHTRTTSLMMGEKMADVIKLKYMGK